MSVLAKVVIFFAASKFCLPDSNADDGRQTTAMAENYLRRTSLPLQRTMSAAPALSKDLPDVQEIEHDQHITALTERLQTLDTLMTRFETLMGSALQQLEPLLKNEIEHRTF